MMADIVLGIGTSHTPQISADWQEWPNLGKQPNPSPYIPEDLEQQLKPETHEKRWGVVQHDIKALGDKLRSTPLDAVVIFGDDQHEQFHDDNMPAIAIYHGEKAEVHDRPRRPGFPELRFEQTKPEYPVAADLAGHLITSLVDQEFDITRVNELKAERGIGHAFSFLYQRLWPECDVPIVPIMINTYYPPNYPTPKRCWSLGQAVAKAIKEWGPGKRVAIMASGGLSHIMMDEEVDHQTLDGLQNKEPELLWRLPRERLIGGTSEVLNWVALDGATQNLKMNLLDYIPGYRSLPSTGCAMTFAYWE
jgi:aromatic ring-opening dioxygenase catalytic subunit (LigB family)